MSYNTKNYTEQGGDVTHFGGKVIFEEGVTVEGGSFTEVKTASTTEKGIVKQAVAVADAEGDAPTAEEYNALLAALRTAGIIATATEE